MKVTFLGTSASTGIPSLACSCPVCQSIDWHDKRLRSSVLVQEGSKNLLIDTGPDVREQMLRENIGHLDGILYTHEHYDHISGLDDIKRYTKDTALPIYGNQSTIDRIKIQFDYNFRAREANTSATAKLIPYVQNPFKPFSIENLEILPLSINHGALATFGYRIGSFAYLLDCKSIPEDSLEYLKNLDVLVITGLRHAEHLNHMNFDEAVAYVERIQPQLTLLSHIGHETSHQNISNYLQRISHNKIQVAYDGLQVEIKEKGNLSLSDSVWLPSKRMGY